MEVKNWSFAALLLILTLLVLGQLGYVGKGVGAASILGGAVPGVEGAIATVSVGGCPTTQLTAVYGYAEESIASPATGVKTGVAGTWSVYAPGTVTPFMTGVSSTTGAGDLGDLPCGAQGYFAVVNGTTSYYAEKVLLPNLPMAPQVNLATLVMDKIATGAVYGFNNTATGTMASSPLYQQVSGAVTLSDMKLRFKANTAQGVIRDPVVCWKFNEITGAANSSTSAYANVSSISMPGWTTVPVATCGLDTDGYHYCFAKEGKISDLGFEEVYPVIVTNSNFGAINATVTLNDAGGTYTAAKDGILFEGCANAATLAEPTQSMTPVDFIIAFNQ